MGRISNATHDTYLSIKYLALGIKRDPANGHTDIRGIALEVNARIACCNDTRSYVCDTITRLVLLRPKSQFYRLPKVKQIAFRSLFYR